MKVHTITLPKKRLESMVCHGARCKEVRQNESIIDHVDADFIINDNDDFQAIVFSDDYYIREQTLKSIAA